MRSINFKFFLIMLPLFLASGLAGYFAGGLKVERTVERLFNLDEAIKLTAAVQTLAILRSGDQDLSIRLLEGRVDTSLLILNWYKEKAENEKQKPILSSLKLASVYRDLYRDEYDAMFGKENVSGADQMQEALNYGSKIESSDYEDFIQKYLTRK